MCPKPLSRKQLSSRAQRSHRGRCAKMSSRRSSYATALSRQVRVRRHLSVKSLSKQSSTKLCPSWRLMRLRKLILLDSHRRQSPSQPEKPLDLMVPNKMPETCDGSVEASNDAAGDVVQHVVDIGNVCADGNIFFFDVIGETRSSQIPGAQDDVQHDAKPSLPDESASPHESKPILSGETAIPTGKKSLYHKQLAAPCKLQSVSDYANCPFPSLAEFQDLAKRGSQTSNRYYAPGSKLQTDDGYLTKQGARTQCFLCGEIHKAWDCPQGRCFVCFESGHASNSCPSRNVYCMGCSARGHRVECCPRNAFGLASRSSLWSRIRCINCGSEGHLNCSTIESFGEATKSESKSKHDKKQDTHKKPPREKQSKKDTQFVKGEDWSCSACGFGPNFASRQECFKCGASKSKQLACKDDQRWHEWQDRGWQRGTGALKAKEMQEWQRGGSLSWSFDTCGKVKRGRHN